MHRPLIPCPVLLLRPAAPGKKSSLSLLYIHICIYTYVCIYTYIHICIYIYIYIYIHIHRSCTYIVIVIIAHLFCYRYFCAYLHHTWMDISRRRPNPAGRQHIWSGRCTLYTLLSVRWT